MITLICIVISLLVALGYYRAHRTKVVDGVSWRTSGALFRALGIFVIGVIISLIQPFSLERVDAGHVGIQVHLTGDSRGIGKFEYKTGWVVINNWTDKLYEFPTYQQTIEYPEQQIITKGGFSATIHPKFNYSLKPGDIGDMFSNLRLGVKSIEQGWLQNAIVGAVNDVANKWAVDDIFNQREKFEGDIIAEANRRVSKWFAISQLRTNIIPPPALQKSIEAKTQAIQEVQVAENQKLVAIAEGEKRIATARADSAALVIGAAGKAEAIKREQLSLTALYIDYLKIQKWNGILPTVQGGSGGMMIQVPMK